MTDLRADAAHREQLEKDVREELSEKLQHAEALLGRARTEVKERDARARACEDHLQITLAEVQALIQQRDCVKMNLRQFTGN